MLFNRKLVFSAFQANTPYVRSEITTEKLISRLGPHDENQFTEIQHRFQNYERCRYRFPVRPICNFQIFYSAKVFQ
jgi:hypothetical protein